MLLIYGKSQSSCFHLWVGAAQLLYHLSPSSSARLLERSPMWPNWVVCSGSIHLPVMRAHYSIGLAIKSKAFVLKWSLSKKNCDVNDLIRNAITRCSFISEALFSTALVKAWCVRWRVQNSFPVSASNPASGVSWSRLKSVVTNPHRTAKGGGLGDHGRLSTEATQAQHWTKSVPNPEAAHGRAKPKSKGSFSPAGATSSPHSALPLGLLLLLLRYAAGQGAEKCQAGMGAIAIHQEAGKYEGCKKLINTCDSWPC